MDIKTRKQATVNLPLTAVKCLYKNSRAEKIVCEIDLSALKKINEPNTIDDMVAEARLEYFAGKTKKFSDSKKLMAYLNS